VVAPLRRFHPTGAVPNFRFHTWYVVLAVIVALAQFGKWWWSIPNSYACLVQPHSEGSGRSAQGAIPDTTSFHAYAVRRPHAHDELPKLPFRIEWVVVRPGSDRVIAYCEDRNTLSSTIACSGHGLIMEIHKASGDFRVGIDRNPTGGDRAGIVMSERGSCDKL
jgi:hypothetical protein